MANLSKTILEKIRVRVYKKIPDDRISLCGSYMEKDEGGKEYFEIPASFAGYIKDVFPSYEIGEEFIPEPIKPAIKTEKVKEENEEVEEDNYIVKGKTIMDKEGNVVVKFRKIFGKYTVEGIDEEFDSVENIINYLKEQK